jgi:hypothetical protein
VDYDTLKDIRTTMLHSQLDWAAKYSNGQEKYFGCNSRITLQFSTLLPKGFKFGSATTQALLHSIVRSLTIFTAKQFYTGTPLITDSQPVTLDIDWDVVPPH